jgi:hypothetical protein
VNLELACVRAELMSYVSGLKSEVGIVSFSPMVIGSADNEEICMDSPNFVPNNPARNTDKGCL